jgi:tripeptidyl-peptidase-1
MSLFTFLLSLVSLLALEAAAAVRKEAYREHGWERKWLAPRDGQIKLHIALRQEDGGREVERHLIQRSDPNNPYYRQYMDAGEATYLSRPALGSSHAVESWLWQHALLEDAALWGGMYEVETTIRSAERLLNTTYFVYSDGAQELVRTELFYLPDSVAGYIDFVTPTTSFPKPAKLKLPKHVPRGQFRSVCANAIVLLAVFFGLEGRPGRTQANFM